MGVRDGARMDPAGHQAGDVSHVDHQIGSDPVGDGAEAGEVDGARIGRAAGDDQPGPVLVGQGLDRVIVDQVGVGRDAIGHGLEPAAGHGGRRAMGQVAAMSQAHAQDHVARL